MVAGQFFALLALFQLVWAPAVLARPTNLVLASGVLLNLGAIALWVVSRTVGAPFGPHAGEPELVQAADLCALLREVYEEWAGSGYQRTSVMGEASKPRATAALSSSALYAMPPPVPPRVKLGRMMAG